MIQGVITLPEPSIQNPMDKAIHIATQLAQKLDPNTFYALTMLQMGEVATRHGVEKLEELQGTVRATLDDPL